MRAAIIAHIGVAPVGAGKIRLGHDQPLGIAGAKLAYTFHPAGHWRQLRSAQLTDNGAAQGLLPPAFGLPVIHHHIRSAQLARHTKFKHAAVQAAVKRQPRIAKRTKGHRNRMHPDAVIYDLMPHQIAQRIGARGLLRQLDRDHRLVLRQCRITSCNKRGINQGRNAIFGRTARDNLAPINQCCFFKIGLRPFTTPQRRICQQRQSRENGKNGHNYLAHVTASLNLGL